LGSRVVIVLDTHIWVWWVHGDDKLPAKHKAYIQDSESAVLGVSAISCWEAAKLVEYGRLSLPVPVGEWLDQALAYPGVRLLELTPRIAPGGGMSLAASWPVYDVQLSQGWDQQAALITILIARRSLKSGKIAAGLFLVDLACLGVKSAQVKLYKDIGEYVAGLRTHARHVQPMGPASFDLAVKIILTGLEYAAGLGFRPDPVFAQAQPLLEGAHPEAVDTPVPTGGPEGKPLFVGGPYDDARKIVDHLTQTLGAGNFHYLVRVGEDDLDLPDPHIVEVDDERELGV
jgi:hypothetical protein